MTPDRHQQISDALLRALELESMEQADFLNRLRREDADLGAEVAALLNVDDDVKTSFLEGSPLPNRLLENTLVEPAKTDGGGAQITRLPADIGPYRLERLLGEGGMGQVFLARQEEPLRRTVALKLIGSALDGKRAAERFESEAKVLAQLEHPNIGRILDAGTTAGGFPFFAMELVEGEPITDYCDRRELPIADRLAIMVEVCRGVEHAHRKQIIHRDLKPSNIMVVEIDGRPVPKIIDFGIAKSMGKVTADGGDEIEGTPAYMSPEAIQGSRDLDTRADVYSLGVLLYLILAGYRPFRGGSLDALIRQVLNEEPPRPSTQLRAAGDKTTGTEVALRRGTSLGSLQRRLKGELDWILQKAVARDREDRYGSVAELAEDLERHAQGRLVKAHPRTFAYLARKWIYRYRLPLVLASLLAGLGGFFLFQDVQARARAERLAQAGLEVARQVEGAEWRIRVVQMLPEHDLTPELAAIRSDLEKLKRDVPSMFRGAEGEAQYALGRGAMSLGDFTAARLALERAWELGNRRPEVAGALGLTLGRLYEQRLSAIRQVPDPKERPRLREQAAAEFLDRAVPLLEQSDEVPGFRELARARLALYRRDYDRALVLSRELAESVPWVFEARFLEAEILEEQAFDSWEGPDENSRRLLEQAAAAAEKGLDLAPSSSDGLFRLCEIRRQQVFLALNLRGHDPVAAHERVLEACRAVQRVRPDMLSIVRLAEATSWGNLADHYVWDLNQDPRPAVEAQGQVLSEVSASEDVELWVSVRAQLERGRGLRLLAQFDEMRSRDPRPTYRLAADHYSRALEIQPSSRQAATELAFLYTAWSNYEQNRGGDPAGLLTEAVSFARRAWKIDPDDYRTTTYLAQSLLVKGIHHLNKGVDPSVEFGEAEELLLPVIGDNLNQTTARGVMINIRLMSAKWRIRTGDDPSEELLLSAKMAEDIVEYKGKAPFLGFTGGHCRIELARYLALTGGDAAEQSRLARQMYAPGLKAIRHLAGPHTELADLALVMARFEMERGSSPLDELARARSRGNKAVELDSGRYDGARMTAEAEALGALWQWRRQGTKARRPSTAVQGPMDELRRIIREDPQQPFHHLALAQVIYDLLAVQPDLEPELIAEGLAAAKESWRLNPTLAEGALLEGAFLATSGQQEQGVRMMELALERNGNLRRRWQPVIERLRPPSPKI